MILRIYFVHTNTILAASVKPEVRAPVSMQSIHSMYTNDVHLRTSRCNVLRNERIEGFPICSAYKLTFPSALKLGCTRRLAHRPIPARAEVSHKPYIYAVYTCACTYMIQPWKRPVCDWYDVCERVARQDDSLAERERLHRESTVKCIQRMLMSRHLNTCTAVDAATALAEGQKIWVISMQTLSPPSRCVLSGGRALQG